VLALTPYWNEESLKVYFKDRAALRENYCDTQDLRPGANAPVNPAKLKALMGLGREPRREPVPPREPGVARSPPCWSASSASRVVAKRLLLVQGRAGLPDASSTSRRIRGAGRGGEDLADLRIARRFADQSVAPRDEWGKWLTDTRGKLLFEAQMKPGDHPLPAARPYHDALTGAQASLHVTFGVSPATALQYSSCSENALSRESEFRSYLPDARSEPQLAANGFGSSRTASAQ
jgi:hypothetical protein